VLFAVEDTGMGIPEDKQAMVMEPFAQADDRLCRDSEGAGLGLPIVSNLVQLMHGEIALQSRVKQGTRVLFCVQFECP
jgi:signal transduction histidine kinase